MPAGGAQCAAQAGELPWPPFRQAGWLAHSSKNTLQSSPSQSMGALGDFEKQVERKPGALVFFADRE